MPEDEPRSWFHWRQDFSAKGTLVKFTPALVKNLFSISVARGAAVAVGAVALAGAAGVGAAEVVSDAPTVQVVDAQSSPNILVQIDEKLDLVIKALGSAQDLNPILDALADLQAALDDLALPPGPPASQQQIDEIQATVDCIAAALRGSEVAC